VTSRGPLGLSIGSGAAGAGAVGGAGVLLSALIAGGRGSVSAICGVAVVLLFFVVSLYLVEVANRVDPSLTLPVGLAVYGTLVGWLILLSVRTSLPDHLDRGAFAWTVIATTLGWLVAQAVGVWRRRAPYVDVELPTSAAVEPAGVVTESDPATLPPVAPGADPRR
jgi:ATP synthase protein I